MPSVPVASVEFAVRFDKIGSSFSEALKKALEGAGFKGGGLGLEAKSMIREIHYNVKNRLRSPFIGRRAADYSIAQAWKGTLKNKEYLESMVEQVKTSKTSKRKLGLEEDAPEEEIKEELEYLFGDTIKYMESILESQESYIAGFPELKNIEGIISESLEGGTQRFRLEKLVKIVRSESKVVKDAIKWLKDRDIKSEDIGVPERLWRRITQTLEPKEGEDEEKELDFETFQELIFKNFGKEKEQRDILFGGPKEIKNYTDELKNLLKKYKIPEGVGLPSGITKILAEIHEKDYREFTKKIGSFKNDLKLIVRDEEQLEELFDVFKRHTTPEKAKESLESAKKILKDFEAVFLVFEAALTGGERKLARDMSRVSELMKDYLLTFGSTNETYSRFEAGAGGEGKRPEEIEDTPAETRMLQQIKFLNDNFKNLKEQIEAIKPADSEEVSNEVAKKIRDLIESLKRIFGE